MSSIPIAECGGVVLAPGDRLLVKAEHAAKLKEHYGRLLIEIGDAESLALRNGTYEHLASGGKAVDIAAHQLSGVSGDEGQVILSAASADKSMVGKRKRIK